MASVPTSFLYVVHREDGAAIDKRIHGMHYYSVLGAAAVKQAAEVNHKLATDQLEA